MLNSRLKNIFIYLAVSLLLSACSEAEQDSPTLLAPTLSLKTDSTTVDYDGSVTLSWSTENIDKCTATGGWAGGKGISGSETISALTSDSTFILSCTGTGGADSDTVSVTIEQSSIPDPTPAPVLPIVSLTASSTTVASDGSVTLNWSSSDADSCIASGNWSGDKNTSGSEIISTLTSDSTFILSCTGTGGADSDTVSVTIEQSSIPDPTPAPVLPIVSLTASSTTVASDGSVTLNWSSSDADSCTASGNWSGDKNISGSEIINSIIVGSTFILNCTGAGGTDSDSVTVSVVMSNTGSALLSWLPPTSNTDESVLTDLAGYKIYYGATPGNYSETIIINSPGITSHVVENLQAGTWYFTMSSFNVSSIESSFSNEVSKMIN